MIGKKYRTGRFGRAAVYAASVFDLSQRSTTSWYLLAGGWLNQIGHLARLVQENFFWKIQRFQRLVELNQQALLPFLVGPSSP
jgi:hypothetical protein